ncbi:stalk domain-containing protein [Bacillus sp. FJAT-45350]|uniref:stalk domain-containing protein n=1 Tax=Bacillus sp. FJAT-45350 TaxID=2011014 RepID=UPI000BB7C6DD|nr:stalk domain-containing protein [Bacillus sp. FJAT-45350]
MKQLFNSGHHSYIVLAILLLFLFPTNSLANSSIEEKCGYSAQPGVNPDYQTVNCLLTETALDYNVPPEIVKGIAEVESGNWRQFHPDGTPIITDDGGIGIMQITLYQDYDQERLKNDIVYNIKSGVEMLDSMFARGDLPKINGHERHIIEHWYFSVMAYNGIKPLNSPIVQATGERNRKAYQEKVFDVIANRSLVTLTELPLDSSHFQYDSNSSNNITFTKDVTTSAKLTESKHFLKKGERATITTNNVRLREQPTTASNEVTRLQLNQTVKISDSFMYELNKNSRNQFVWYPVELTDGKTGYIASSYLEQTTAPIEIPTRKSTIILHLNNTTAQVNGSSVKLDAAPYTTNGRTLVPLRFISENLGANVHWDGPTRTITIQVDGKTLTLREGSRTISVTQNGSHTNHTIEVAPIIRNGVTSVPIRFISEQIGASVDWNSQARRITIQQ